MYEKELNIRQHAKRIIDLSHLSFDLGYYFNPVGNFNLYPFQNGKWLCVLRVFGYYISGGRFSYLTHPNMKLEHPDEHLFLVLDEEFNLMSRLELVENDYYHVPEFDRETPYLEDGRLVEWNGNLYLTSAIFYQNNEQYEKFGLEVQRIELNGKYVCAKHVWSSVESGIMGRHKNWMAVQDTPFKFVTGTSANGATAYNIQHNIGIEVCDYDPDDLYRGNTNLLNDNFRKCYYAITHKLTQDELWRKKYQNYLIEYSPSLRPVSISRPFKFCERSIEFVTCMLPLPNNELLVCVTEMDDTPEIHIYDRDRFLELVSKG